MPKLSPSNPKLVIRRDRFPTSGLFSEIQSFANSIRKHFVDVNRAVNDLFNGPVLPTYTVAGVPAASTNTRRLIYISDETGGAVPAFSDGTNWRRVTDRVIIS